MKICVAGAWGRMGRRILELAMADEAMGIGGAFDAPDFAGKELTLGAEGVNLYEITLAANAMEALAGCDVLIDFSVASACPANMTAAAELGKPVVLGTTGLSDAEKDAVTACAERVAVVYAPNMSVGVNLLFKLTSEVAARLGEDYNIEITEIHHNQKKDSPSGTAVRLAERAAEALGWSYARDTAHGRQGMIGKRPTREIGVHALRGGDVVGEHTVSFIGQGERIELTHKAHNRDNFARGALRAALYVKDAEPGLYDMQDVLGLKA